MVSAFDGLLMGPVQLKRACFAEAFYRPCQIDMQCIAVLGSELDVQGEGPVEPLAVFGWKQCAQTCNDIEKNQQTPDLVVSLVDQDVL